MENNRTPESGGDRVGGARIIFAHSDDARQLLTQDEVFATANNVERLAGVAQVFRAAQTELRQLGLSHLFIAYSLSRRLGLTRVSQALRAILDDLRAQA